jgi:hypothetical protein
VLQTILGILLLLWLLGSFMHVGAGLVYGFLAIAFVVLVFSFLSNRRSLGCCQKRGTSVARKPEPEGRNPV